MDIQKVKFTVKKKFRKRAELLEENEFLYLWGVRLENLSPVIKLLALSAHEEY